MNRRSFFKTCLAAAAAMLVPAAKIAGADDTARMLAAIRAWKDRVKQETANYQEMWWNKQWRAASKDEIAACPPLGIDYWLVKK